MSDGAESGARLPQCSFHNCAETSETVVRYYDEELEADPETTAPCRWLMEYCGPHAGFVVTHYPNNPKVLGPQALRQHWNAFTEAARNV